MTKKVLQFGLLLAILSFSMSAFAQEKPRVQDYPRMGFWSNWSIGADFGYNMQIRSNCPDTYYHGFGGHVFFQKKIHPLWSIRLSLGMPRMNQSDSTGATVNSLVGEIMGLRLASTFSGQLSTPSATIPSAKSTSTGWAVSVALSTEELTTVSASVPSISVPVLASTSSSASTPLSSSRVSWV